MGAAVLALLCTTEAYGHGVRDAAGKSALSAKHHAPKPAPFVNKVDAPPTPAKTTFGSSLQGMPEPLLGDFSSDAEFWDAFLAAAQGVATGMVGTAPLDGWLSGVTLRGDVLSGDMPGPGGSEPFRVGVGQVLSTGQVEVISTSNPPFTLPGTIGSYYYSVGPPYTGFNMRLKKGEVVSLDTRGGKWAVFALVNGSVTDSFAATGLSQNAGMIWTPTPNANVELLMQVTEQPSVPTTWIEHAEKTIVDAGRLEEQAGRLAGSRLKRKLKQADELLNEALAAIHLAASSSGAEPQELSQDTATSVQHLLGDALAEDGLAAAKGLSGPARAMAINEAGHHKLLALRDLHQAAVLAKRVP